MFSGLSKNLKKILPKRLFYRALIIVAAPTIILQFIITVVFYDSIWIKANKNTTRALVAQLKTINEIYKNDKKNLDFSSLLKVLSIGLNHLSLPVFCIFSLLVNSIFKSKNIEKRSSNSCLFASSLP